MLFEGMNSYIGVVSLISSRHSALFLKAQLRDMFEDYKTGRRCKDSCCPQWQWSLSGLWRPEIQTGQKVALYRKASTKTKHRQYFHTGQKEHHPDGTIWCQICPWPVQCCQSGLDTSARQGLSIRIQDLNSLDKPNETDQRWASGDLPHPGQYAG